MKSLRAILIVQIFFSLGMSSVVAQTTARMTTGGTGYLEYLPPNYSADPAKKYPIMFFLHGTGETGNGSPGDLEKVKAAGPPKLIKDGHSMCFTVNGVEECFIVISPQLGPSKGGWWPNIQGELFDYVLNGPHNYKIDKNRIYLTGLSLGGQGVYMGVGDASLPDIFAAAIPIAAFGNVNGCNISARKIPMWGFHGENDSAIKYGDGWTEFMRIQWCKTPVPTAEYKWTPYPGVGHNAWDKAYTTDHSVQSPLNIYEWLLTKTKSNLPIANAGPNVTTTLPTNSISISGSATDAGGSIQSYAWTKVTGGNATLTNASTATLQLSDLVEGVYTFKLTVTDNDGNNASDDVTVTVYPEAVNLAPVIAAASDITITLPTTSTNITATVSDNDGTGITYTWVQESGPTANLAGTNSATLSVSNLLSTTTYSFRITAIDDDGASATALRNVIVKPAAINQPPTASAGIDKIVNLPTSTTNIIGSGSDPEGGTLTYFWERTGGPAASLANITSPTLTVTNLVAGIYTFRLTITDSQGLFAQDDVVVTVIAANLTPTANAGNDFAITLPTNSTNIVGSGIDLDGSVISYTWTRLTGPNVPGFVNASSSTVTVNGLIQGQYTFRLTVTDNSGSIGTDDVKLTVNAAPVDNPPTADAGQDKSITLPTNFITLNGSGSDAEGPVTYSWTKLTGPPASLANQNTPNLDITSLTAGSYTFQLTVTDNALKTKTDVVAVTVQPAIVNQSPVANAGSDVFISLPITTATLSGSGLDNDGSIASYQWIQTTGTTVALTGQNTQTLQVSGLTTGTFTFQLTVTDDKNATHFDEVKVIVSAGNASPSANAGIDKIFTLPVPSIVITGAGLDSDGIIASYAWTLTSGTPGSLSNQNTNEVTLSGVAAGVYTLRLTVTDDDGAVGTDDIKITVNSLNVAPIANAGNDKSITLPTNSTNLVGSGTDPEGPIASYVWEQLSGPTASLTNAGSATVTVGVSLAGIYVFRLNVTDNAGNTDFDDVQLVVNAANVNQPPVANAGPNRTITLPVNTLVLPGSGTDPEGGALTYVWEKSGGPAATLANSNTATLSLSNLLEGTYSFRLTVTDNGMLSDQKSVTVNVLPQTVNQTPTANAGEDIALTLPTNSITLFGTGSDPDGSIATYTWSKISGPVATLTNETTATLTLTNLTVGAYVFRLTVTDDQSATGIDDVVLTINDVGANQLPISNAGPDRIIILPSSSININGNGSDDGSINNYLWTKTGGPSATLINSSKPVLTASDLIEGTYTFSLQVTDDQGVTNSDEMVLQVLSASINQPPNVNAGSDVSLILPKNNITLKGAASDGGSIVSYEWTQVSAGASTMSDIDQPNLLLTNLTQGQYAFRLTATDNEGAIGTDDVILTVLPSGTNLAPTANAGPDLSIKLPANSILINGIGNDIDGTIAAYKWIKVNGPSATLGNTTTASLSISNLLEGKYTLRLTVTDNGGLSSSADIDLVVLPANFNQNPIANAGANVFVTLPSNTAILNGSGVDPDGTIATYSWSRRLGPTTVTESGNTTQTLSLTDLVVGTYLYRLTITDDKGGTTFDEVSVFVTDENTQVENDPPIANAGADKILPKGTTTTTLTGSFEDTGLIKRVEWTQISGGDAILQGVNENVLVLSNLTSGSYEFAFTVYDALDVSDTDEVKVSVENRVSVDADKFFSPNGDNQNDVWILDADESKFENCSLVIFNSQGINVFEAKPYQNNWNGTRNGQALPEDVYFFVLECDGGKSSGSITLLR